MASGNKADRPRFSRVLARATTDTLNLVVAGAAGLAAAATGSWAVLAIGGAAYAALVGLEASNPRSWKRAAERGLAGRSPAALPPEKSVRDPTAREAVRALRASHEELDRVLAETPEDVIAHLGEGLASLTELEARAARLVGRAEELASFLAGADPEAVRQELARLERRVASTADKQARAEFASAAEARREHLRAIEDIAGAKERTDANLNRIVATLSGLPAKLMRMRALDAQAMDDLGGDVGEELDRMNADMRAFEETLRTVTEAVAT